MVEYRQASFKIDSKLHDKLKIKAIEEGRTQREIIEEAIMNYLDKSQTKLNFSEENVE